MSVELISSLEILIAIFTFELFLVYLYHLELGNLSDISISDNRGSI